MFVFILILVSIIALIMITLSLFVKLIMQRVVQKLKFIKQRESNEKF